MRIAIITDTYPEQINGVVTTLRNVSAELRNTGHEVVTIDPSCFKTVSCPGYPEIKLAWNTLWGLPKILKEMKADCYHIATEGPIGLTARLYLAINGIAHSTSYHTKFPEYLAKRYPIPLWLSYAYFRWFHYRAKHVLVTTKNMYDELSDRGFRNLIVWSRGVDMTTYSPSHEVDLGYARPIHINVGRVSVEKGLEDFLSLDLPGTKLIVGDGPELMKLKEKYPDVVFVGMKTGHELATYYASSDVFVFPSKTDTFGVVMLEAMASGLPIAAYPVTGPIDVVENGMNGYLNENLNLAIAQCYSIPKSTCVEQSKKFTWSECTKVFLQHLVRV